jgi:ubiquitin carboxyl-terminal hydrolase 25/28
MCAGDKKYVNPAKVLKSITNDSGEPIELGDQKDIGEFNDSFLSRVQEGLNFKKLYDQMLKIKKKQEARS